MDPVIQNLTIGGAIAVLIIRDVLNFLKAKKDGGEFSEKNLYDKLRLVHHDLSKVARRSEDIWKWLEKEDANGVKLYYNVNVMNTVKRLQERVDSLKGDIALLRQEIKTLKDEIRKQR